MSLKQTSGSTRPSINTLRKQTVGNDVEVIPPIFSERSGKLIRAMSEVSDTDAIVREVHSLWSNVKQSFLVIGQYLMRAKDVIRSEIVAQSSATKMTSRDITLLTAKEYQNRVLDHLPFGRSSAVQLEAVARAVFVEGRLKVEELPTSHSTAYLLTTLTDSQLESARKQGVVHPEVLRSTVQKFKSDSELKTLSPLEELGFLTDRRAELLRSMSKLEQELKSIESRLRQVQSSS